MTAGGGIGAGLGAIAAVALAPVTGGVSLGTVVLGAQIGFVGGTIIDKQHGGTVGAELKDDLNESTGIGRANPEIFGTMRIDQAYYIWADPIRSIKEEEKAGLFSTQDVIENFADFSVGFARGPLTVMDIRFNETLVYQRHDPTQPILSPDLQIDEFIVKDGNESDEPTEFEKGRFGEFAPGYPRKTRFVAVNMRMDHWRGYPRVKATLTDNLTATFPLVELLESSQPSGQAPNTGNALWLNDNTQFVSRSGTTADADFLMRMSVNGATLTEAHFADHTFADWDSVWGHDPFDDLILTRRGGRHYGIDPETLTALWVTEEFTTTSGETNGHFGATGFGRAQAVDSRKTYWAQDGKWSVFDRSQSIGVTVTLHGNLPTAPLVLDGDYSVLFGSTANARSAREDSTGTLWVLVKVAAEAGVRLVSHSAFSGDAEQIITLSELDAGSGRRMGYARDMNALFGFGTRVSDAQEVAWRYDLTTSTLTMNAFPPVAGTYDENKLEIYANRVYNNRIWLNYGAGLVMEFSLETLDQIRTIDTGNWAKPGGNDYFDFTYSQHAHGLVSWRTPITDRTIMILLDRGTGGNTNLQVFTERVFDRLGYAAADLDATGGAGYVWPGDIIDNLQPAARDLSRANDFWFVLGTIEDWQYRIPVRGAGVGATLNLSDMGARAEGDAAIDEFKETFRHEGAAISSSVVLNFKSSDDDYSNVTTPEPISSGELVTQRINVVTTKSALTRQLAADYVARAQAVERAQDRSYEVKVGIENLRLTRGVVANWLAADDLTKTMIIEDMEFDANDVITLKGPREDLQVFDLTGTPDVATTTPPVIPVYASARLAVLDEPHAEPGRADLALHGFVYAENAGTIPNLVVVETTTNEVVASIDANDAANVGRTTTTIPAPVNNQEFWDGPEDYTITIAWPNSQPADLGKSVVPWGASTGFPQGVFAVETDTDGEYEYMAIANQADNGDGTATGSTILRGMFNTWERAVARTRTNRRVIQLTSATMITVPIPAAWAGTTRTSALGRPGTDTVLSLKTLTVASRSTMPYPVNIISGTRDGSNDWDLTIYTRALDAGPNPPLGNRWPGVADVQLEVYFYTDGTFTTVGETLTTTALANGSVVTIAADPNTHQHSAKWEAADQTAGSFGGVQSTIYVGIVQVNNGISGPERQATFTA